MTLTAQDYAARDATALAELVRNKEVSAPELTELAIALIEEAEGGPEPLGAVVVRAFDKARALAASVDRQAPLAGVPFLLKDIGPAWAGVPLTAGSRALANFRPTRDGHLVKRYLKAGLIPLGRTATPEFGLVPFTEPAAYQPVSTPFKRGHTAGGSSGGSAAAVASGLVPAAHGNDGGGSLRIPASCCGLFGLKPTRGRTPMGPELSESWFGFVAEHALTRTVRDSALLLDVSQGPEPGALLAATPAAASYRALCDADPPPLRVGIPRASAIDTPIHPDCQAARDACVSRLEALGHEIFEVDLGIDSDQFLSDFFLHVCVGAALELAEVKALLGGHVPANAFEIPTRMLALRGGQIPAAAFARARRRLNAAARKALKALEPVDVLLEPTLAKPPVEHGALLPKGLEAALQELIVRANLGFLLRLPGAAAQIEKSARVVFAFMPACPLSNVSGQPSMSVPFGLNSQGLPIGVHFTGRFGDEATLFRLAAQLERCQPFQTPGLDSWRAGA